MKYWTIHVDVNHKDTGRVFPQVSCTSQMWAHRLNSDEFPKTDPQLNFEMVYRAKFSDIIGNAAISACGLLISKRLKKIFEEYNLITHKFFEARIKHYKNNNVENYYWLHPFNPDSHRWINYDESKFFYTQYGFRENELKISSLEDRKIQKEKVVGRMGTIEAESIKLNEAFDRNLDLFNIKDFDHDIHVSSQLKERMEKEGLKGIKYKKSICAL